MFPSLQLGWVLWLLFMKAVTAGEGGAYVYPQSNSEGSLELEQFSGTCIQDSEGEDRMFEHNTRMTKDKSSADYLALTHGICMEACRAEDFLYAGLRDSQECHCSNTSPTPALIVDDDQCQKSCRGDPAQICGGEFTMSVFSTNQAQPSRNRMAQTPYEGSCTDKGCSVAFGGFGMCVDFSATVDFSSLADIFNLAAGSQNGTCGHSEDKEDCCHCLEVAEPHRPTTTTAGPTTTTIAPTTPTTTTIAPTTTTTAVPTTTPCHDEVVLVLGGDTADHETSSVEALHMCGDSSFTTTDLPESRWGHTAVTLANSEVLVCGGKGMHHTVALARTCISLQADSWQDHSQLLMPRIYSSAVTMPSGDSFLLGGWYSSITSEILKAGETNWTKGPTLPHPLDSACAVVLNSTSFATIGGGEGHTSVTTHDTTQDLLSRDWTALPEGRRAHSCALVGDQILVAGGFSYLTFDYTDSTILIDTTTGVAKPAGAMVGARAYFVLQAVAFTVLAMGGISMDGFTGEVDVYKPSTTSWINSSSFSLTTPRSSFATVILGPKTSSDTTFLLTGGWDGSRLTSVETFPISCAVPDLPEGLNGPMTFLTADSSPSIVTCGGETDNGFNKSCLSLQGSWVGGLVGDLPNDRSHGSAVTLPGHGVYLLGGDAHAMRVTSDLLKAGSDVWVAGPALPESMAFPCTVALSTSFLTVNGRSVREYDISSGWKSQNTWPYLQTGGDIGYHPGCALVGQTLIVAGGADHGSRDTIEVLDMETKTVSWGPNMIQKRRFFQLGQVQPGTRTLALGGSYKGGQHSTTRMYVDTVEELVGEAWEEVGSLQVARCEHGGVTVPLSMVCAPSTTYITTTTLPTTPSTSTGPPYMTPIYTKAEEHTLVKNTLLTTLDTLGKEWRVTHDFKATSYLSGYGMTLQLTIGSYGDRQLFFSYYGGRLEIGSVVSGSIHWHKPVQPPVGEWTTIAVSMTLEEGKYMYRINIDGQEIHAKENTQPQEFTDVKVYASNPWRDAQPGSIRNLVIETKV